MGIFFANSKSRAPGWFRSFCSAARKLVGPYYQLSHEQLSLANANVQIAEPCPTPMNGTLYHPPPQRKPSPSFASKPNGLFSGRYGDCIAENEDEAEYLEERDDFNVNEFVRVERRNSSLTPDGGLPGKCYPTGARRMSVSIPKQRTSFSLATPSQPRLQKLSSVTMISDQNHFTSLVGKSEGPVGEQLAEMDVMEEWKVLANVLNRCNGCLFTLLLVTCLLVYVYFHAPP